MTGSLVKEAWTHITDDIKRIKKNYSKSQNEVLIYESINGHAWRDIEHAMMFQTLKPLRAILNLLATSQMEISPVFVPTENEKRKSHVENVN